MDTVDGGVGPADDQDWSLGWEPPTYTVDRDGKVVGLVNDHEPNNWGRWGDLDERGTLNFITPDAVREAASLVRLGRVINCSIPIGEGMPVHPSRPAVAHTFSITGTDLLAGGVPGRSGGGFFGSDDYVFMPLQSATHWDGLAHSSWQDAMYNGFWIGNVGAYEGARRNSTHLLKDRIVGRGVLLDLPRFLGTDRLLPGHAISPHELDACAEHQGTTIKTGDILLVRTGELAWFYTLESTGDYFTAGHPGLSMAAVEWIHQKQIAALAMDNRSLEVEPFEQPAECMYPVHVRLIRDLGLTIGELWWLEELADACVDELRWEFMLVAAPMTVMNASGAPTSPIAVL